MTPPTIRLYRHAQVDCDLRQRIRARDVRAAIAAYNNAPIRQPPDRTREACSGQLICSPLRRSLETADLLLRQPDLVDSCFREAELPDPAPLPMRLTVQSWFALSRGLWCLRAAQNCESLTAFRARIVVATTKLMDLARDHGQVTLMGHGVLNRFIAGNLLKHGYTGPKVPMRTHCGMSCYVQS